MKSSPQIVSTPNIDDLVINVLYLIMCFHKVTSDKTTSSLLPKQLANSLAYKMRCTCLSHKMSVDMVDVKHLQTLCVSWRRTRTPNVKICYGRFLQVVLS